MNIPFPSVLAKDMTKREMYALAAMQGMLAGGAVDGPDIIAWQAFRIADAMLEESEMERADG